MANNTTSFVDASISHAVCLVSVANYNYPNNPLIWIFVATFNGIASLPTVVLNALIIWAVFGDETLRSSAFNVFLAFLAVTDLLVGLLVEPMFCVIVVCDLNGCYSPCKITAYLFLMVGCCGTTVVTLALACAERYLAIEHPNFYLKNIASLTGKRVMTATMVFWTAVVGLLVIGTTFLKRNYPSFVKVPLAVVLSICALVIVYCSFKVQLTAYRQSKEIANQVQSVQQQEQIDEQQQQQQQIEERRKEYKRVFTMTMLVIMSVVFYTPFVVAGVIEAMKGEDFMTNYKRNVDALCVTFLHLQSLMNPIVMSLRLSYIRQGIKNRLLCITEN